MRSGLVRAFSTTRRIAQQQLFVPYERPLNERQKKAIRKIARADEPNYHVRFNTDAQWVVEAFNRSEDQRALLKTTLQRVRDIVKRHAGSNYDVVDISMHTYSRHVHDAPFEFAIVDKSRPDGLSPEEDQNKLPVVYDASRLSEIMMQEGFTGGFWAPPWDRRRAGRRYGNPAYRDLTIPWSDYQRPAFRELLYPVRMLTYSPVAFFLTLPGPSVLRLHRLIHNYFELQPSMASLLTLLFAWTRSYRMDEFTTQCLALMVIRYFQEIGKAPNLMNPEDPMFKGGLKVERHDQKLWVPFQYQVPLPNVDADEAESERQRECRVEPTLLNYTVMEPKPTARYVRKPGSMFWDFINFWRIGLTISRTYALSVGQNKYLKRQIALLRDKQREEPSLRLFDTLEKTSSWIHQFDYKSPTYNPAMHPLTWPWHALVVQDPFIPTYNHADSVSRVTMRQFVLQSQKASRSLSHDWPFVTAFGEYFVPPKEKKAGVFMYKRGFSPALRKYHVNAVKAEPKDRHEISDPPEPILEARRKTISRVQVLIRKKFGYNYAVQAFGSTEYGVSSSDSDLDLVVIDPERMSGFPSGTSQLPEIYNIKKVARALWSAGFTKVTALPAARVPIVKFRDQLTGIDCDLNINEQLGRLNTGMIKRYCDLVPILRPMVAFIKRWAKPFGLNSPSIQNGSPTFSSYALMLMTISFLQSRGLAPNLQADLGPYTDWDYMPENNGFFWLQRKTRAGKITRIRCDTRYHLGQGWVAEHEMDYEDALAAWFQYWGYAHPYPTSVGSIRQGGFVLKQPYSSGFESPSLSTADAARLDLSRQSHLDKQSDTTDENQVRGQMPVPSMEPSVLSHVEQVIESADTPVAREPSAVDETKSEAHTTPNPILSTTSENRYTGSALEVESTGSNLTMLAHKIDGVGGTSKGLTIPVEEDSNILLPGRKHHEKPPRWLDHPLCIVDPFVRSMVVTRNINNRWVELFRQNCKRTATMLSWGASLEGVLARRPKKNPKMSKASSKLNVSTTPVPSENSSSEVSPTPDTIDANIFLNYPGAHRLGPMTQASLVSRTNELVIDVEDPLELEEFENPPPRKLEDSRGEFSDSVEDEQEGFGLKKKFFDDPEMTKLVAHMTERGILSANIFSLPAHAHDDNDIRESEASDDVEKSEEEAVNLNMETGQPGSSPIILKSLA